MPNSMLSEIYFVAGMMILILILCAVATYAFFKTYYAEMRMREEEKRKKAELEKTKKVEANR